jgi:hypothetical protein
MKLKVKSEKLKVFRFLLFRLKFRLRNFVFHTETQKHEEVLLDKTKIKSKTFVTLRLCVRKQNSKLYDRHI